MSTTRIATRYAKSLLDLAIESNTVDLVFQDIQGLDKALESKDFANLLKSPVIPSKRKADIFKLLFESKVSALTFGFFNLVIRKGRESVFQEIIQQFYVQYRKLNNIVIMRLTTAVQLDDDAVEAIKKEIAAKGITNATIEMNTKVDPKLIGGFQIEFEDKLIDASIQHKLAVMRRELAINLYESKIRSI
jgi:F-type H+-transporting ATPase subunit delta